MLSEKEEITKHFQKWKRRGEVEEWKILSVTNEQAMGGTIRVVIVMRGEEFTIVPPRGYIIKEVTIINILRMRFELFLKKETKEKK
tara:strand:- start:42 stop:299 length:258 start_codon:yes stop_codon:yes gene_type:complete